MVENLGKKFGKKFARGLGWGQNKGFILPYYLYDNTPN